MAKANDRQVGGTHYQMPIQPWDFITVNAIPFLEGTAIAYIVRHGRKRGREDLEKAIHYLQKAIEVYYPTTTPAEGEEAKAAHVALVEEVHARPPWQDV